MRRQFERPTAKHNSHREDRRKRFQKQRKCLQLIVLHELGYVPFSV